MRNRSDNEKLLLSTRELIIGRLHYTVNDRLSVLNAYLKTKAFGRALIRLGSKSVRQVNLSQKPQSFFQISSQN